MLGVNIFRRQIQRKITTSAPRRKPSESVQCRHRRRLRGRDDMRMARSERRACNAFSSNPP
ncbi:hypothetical protein KCP74_20845 [Salmonella enterica subsp. enterica]|nr:hypothetical protein KCP74_20845 [Salmonella enterica subsp. enterica]